MDKTLQGKRIKLIEMCGDPYPIEPNTMGTIQYADGLGQLQVIWDNGRRLAVIPNIDEYEILN
jgi:hypothetical protein